MPVQATLISVSPQSPFSFPRSVQTIHNFEGCSLVDANQRKTIRIVLQSIVGWKVTATVDINQSSVSDSKGTFIFSIVLHQ